MFTNNTFALTTIMIVAAASVVHAKHLDIAAAAPATERDRASLVEMARLDPKDFKPGNTRLGDNGRSDLDRLIARYNETLMLDPNDDDAYFRRGIANFYAGAFAKARADIGKASELDPQYPYYALWLHIIDRRVELPSRLAQAVARFDMTKWPAPIIRLFLDQTSAPAVLAAAADPDGPTLRGQVCEANFYIGQLALQRNAASEATYRFRLAALDCPNDFVEGPAASAELIALGRQ